MTPRAAVLVGVGGSVGALLRYAVGAYLPVKAVPLPTFTVNVLGSFALAVLTFGSVGNELLLFAGIGACGAFTTFSSFAVETVELWDHGEPIRAVTYAVGTGVAAAIGVATGYLIAPIV